MIFSDINEIHRAYENNAVELQAKIKARVKEFLRDEATGEFKENIRLVDTTVGRAIAI